MELTNENYHSVEMRQEYMGYSQFKSFQKCEKEGLALVRGEAEEKLTDALLFGSYVDAYFSKEMDTFLPQHPEMFNSKTGELKSQFKTVDAVIDTIEKDPLLLKYLSGEHQVIMTGVIAGVKFKIKIDSYFPGKAIVDQKVVRDMNPVWIEKVDEHGNVHNVKVDFVEAYRYDLEGAIYREIVRQNTGFTLPFILAVTTKEDSPDKALIEIDPEYLDAALNEVIELAPRYQAIKEGKIAPNGCGKCSVCRSTKMVTGVRSYKQLFHNDTEDIEY